MSKYNSRLTEYNGAVYHSKLEATVAEALDELLPDDYVWDSQVPFLLIDKSKHGRAITYRADFVLYLKSYRRNEAVMVIEVKGYPTDVYRLKKRLLVERYPAMLFRVIGKLDELGFVLEELRGAA